MEPDFGFIDFHIHLMPLEMLKPHVRAVFEGSPGFPLKEYHEAVSSPERLIQAMDSAGIERMGLITYTSPDVMGLKEEIIPFIARYAKEYPDRLFPFSSPHPLSEGAVEKLEEMVSKQGIRGLKIHPVHQLVYPNAYRQEENGSKGLGALYQKAEDLGIPVMIHTGTSIFPGARIKYGDPIALDDVASDFPKLKIIMSHGGRPIWMETAFFLMRRHRNLHLEISGIPPKNLLKYFPRLAEIADRIIYGSDWPSPGIPHLRRNIDEILKLDLPEEIKRKILRENALKFY